MQVKLPTGTDPGDCVLDADVVDAGKFAGTVAEVVVLQSQRDGSVSQGHH